MKGRIFIFTQLLLILFFLDGYSQGISLSSSYITPASRNFYLHKGQSMVTSGFMVQNFADQNDDTIPTANSLLACTHPELEWVSFRPALMHPEIAGYSDAFFCKRLFYPFITPNGPTSINRYNADFHISATHLNVGETYSFSFVSCSEISGGLLGFQTCVGSQTMYIHIIPYNINILEVMCPSGSMSDVRMKWRKPDITYWNINHYAIIENLWDTVRMSNMDSSRIVRNFIGLNDTIQHINLLKFPGDGFCAVAGYDSLGQIVALSESYRPVFPAASFSLLGPPDGQVISTSTPTFSWQNFGTGNFELWLSLDSAFTNPKKFLNINNVSFLLTSPLQDHCRYWWKVVSNGGIASNNTWTFSTNITPQAPGTFNLNSPANGATITALNPVFSWNEPVDPGDKLQYSILVSSTPAFTDTLIYDHTGSNFYYPAANLPNHRHCYWKVLARDVNGLTSASSISMFYTKSDSPPLDFNLISPVFCSDTGIPAQTSLFPVFQWHRSLDPDTTIAVHYTLWYGTDPDFMLKTEVNFLTDTIYIPPVALLEDKLYFWKVKATDHTGKFTWSMGQPYAFVTNAYNHDPAPVEISSPADNRIVPPDNLVIRWNHDNDPDLLDAPMFEVLYSKDSTFQTAVHLHGIRFFPEYFVPSSLDTGKYYLKIASDFKSLPATFYGTVGNGGYSISRMYHFEVRNSYLSHVTPNGGESLEATQVYPVTMTGLGVDTVKIEVSFDNENSWETVAERVPFGTYYWRTPNRVSDICKIRISDIHNSNRWAQSEAVFSLISPTKSLSLGFPNGPEVLRRWSTQELQWTSAGVDSVQIEFSYDNGLHWLMVSPQHQARWGGWPADQGKFSWLVPNYISTLCLVRITDFFYPQLSIQSPVNFSIVPYPVIFVSTSGNDTTGTGTSGYPYRSIGKAVSVCASRDSIRVAEGTYNESVTLPAKFIYLSGGYDSVSWIKDYQNHRSIINPGGLNAFNADVQRQLDIDGFYITNADFAIAAGHTGNTFYLYCHHVNISNSAGIASSFQGNRYVFNGCVFRNCGGIMATNLGSAISVVNCIFDSVTNCLSVSSNEYGLNFTVDHNTFYHCNQVIALNILHDYSSLIENNIFSECTNVLSNLGAGTLTFGYNMTYNCNLSCSACLDEGGNFAGDPLFADPANENFALLPCSHALGSGVLSATTVDLDSNPRPEPAGSNPDIGALESNLPFPATPAPPVISCPPAINVVTDPGKNYATINNLTPATATATCSLASLSGNAPANMQFPLGSNTITWTATDISGLTSTCAQVVNVISGSTLSGWVKYDRASGLVSLSNVIISLMQGNTVTGSDTTDINGNYSISGLAPGNYQVAFSTNKLTAGAINVTDAAQANAWPNLHPPIDSVKFLAGDVIGNGIGTVNNRITATDATRILQYFVYNGVFPAGQQPFTIRNNWTFWFAGGTIDHNPVSVSTILVPVVTIPTSGITLTSNFYGLVTGDFNRSYNPSDIPKSLPEQVTLNAKQSRVVSFDENVEWPVNTETALAVGAISLVLQYPGDHFTVKDVVMKNSDDEHLMFNAEGNELRIGWFADQPVKLQAGDQLFSIILQPKSLISHQRFSLKLVESTQNELADEQGVVLNNAQLTTSFLSDYVNESEMSQIGDLGLVCQPNPGSHSTQVSYQLPAEGNVRVFICNTLGINVVPLVDEIQKSGSHSLNFNAETLAPGCYYVHFTFGSREINLEKTIRFVRLR